MKCFGEAVFAPSPDAPGGDCPPSSAPLSSATVSTAGHYSVYIYGFVECRLFINIYRPLCCFSACSARITLDFRTTSPFIQVIIPRRPCSRRRGIYRAFSLAYLSVCLSVRALEGQEAQLSLRDRATTRACQFKSCQLLND